jgi:hypothetical protein
MKSRNDFDKFIADCHTRIAQERTPVKKPRKRRKAAPLEKKPEREASRLMREDGAEVVKLNVIGQKSWPDRLVCPPGVKCRVVTCWTVEQAMEAYRKAKRDKVLVFIEYKRDADHPLSELQRDLQIRLMFGVPS